MIPELRVLLGPPATGERSPAGRPGTVLDDAGLLGFYAAGTDHDRARPWLRANMVSSVDGAAQGPGGLSGGLGTPADRRVFDVLRGLADVVLVGAGTARAERYTSLPAPDGSAVASLRRSLGQAPAPVLAVVSSSGLVDLDRLSLDGGPVVLVCSAATPEAPLGAARRVLGPDGVIVVPAAAGSVHPDLRAVRRALADRGLPRILTEGGPHLLSALIAADAVDELDLTVAPLLMGGDVLRILAGPPIERPVRSAGLISDGSTLLGRWLLSGP